MSFETYNRITENADVCIKPQKSVSFTFEGKGFLYHMIRILVGTLLEVGKGQHSPESIPIILESSTSRRGTFLQTRMASTVELLESRFQYPMFVKPAGTGSSVGVSKAADRASLSKALDAAAAFDDKVLVEEFIHGREVEVAVMGNGNPVASICGEIDSGAEFYDYDAKYVTDTSVAYVPARIPEDVQEQVREAAVKVYKAIGCKGLSRVDFFVTYEGNRVVFNEINTLPGFTSISMYPKLFAASGIPYPELIDSLLELAMEAGE